MTDVKVGIDPGWKNLGLAILNRDDKPIHVETYNCSDFGTPAKAIVEIMKAVEGFNVTSIGIERYVTYGRGTPTAEAENVQHVIGALSYAFEVLGTEPVLMRAIDWKTRLCKHLYKKQGYKNPSDRFDKKYSFSVAETVCGIRPSTDHEADAVGIAYLVSQLKRA